MTANYNDMLALAKIAIKADASAPVAYSFKNSDGKVENYSAQQVNDALRAQIEELVPAGDYYAWQENKNTVFRLITEVLDEILPKKVEAQYMQFAEVKTIPQGDRAVFRQRVTEAARKRAKSFVTAVGLAGRYETFMLDGTEITVKTSAMGAAARIGLEEFLDGRWQLSDFTSIILEGMDEYIYKEIAKALQSLVTALPTANKVVANKFDEKSMDEILAIADAYGNGPAQIFCTFEFAATMKPDANWASSDMKNTLWTQGAFTSYKGHQINILPQSLEDVTNTKKVIDPSMAYIIPAGSDKPIKLVFEGQTLVREIENQLDDWSREMQTYKKFGIATFTNYWICSYQNTSLTTATRSTTV